MHNLKLMFKIFLIMELALAAGQTQASETTLSTEKLKCIAKSIRTIEDSLENIRIDCNAWVEKGPSAAGPWERTPVFWSMTAYYDKIESDRVRIDVHKSVTKWKNGAAPYFQESFSIGFDGEEGRIVKISASYNGKTFDRDTAFIYPKPPMRLKGLDQVTGIEASLFFHYRYMPEPLPKRFSANFEAAADPNSFLVALAKSDPNYSNIEPVDSKVGFAQLEGIECIKTVCTPGPSVHQWWLDPNRGFALLRFEHLQKDEKGNERLVELIEVTKLKQFAENIWWPMEAYFVQRPRQGENSYRRIVYRASDVIVNDPNFDESVFTVPIPEGYSVNAGVQKFITGEK